MVLRSWRCWSLSPHRHCCHLHSRGKCYQQAPRTWMPHMQTIALLMVGLWTGWWRCEPGVDSSRAPKSSHLACRSCSGKHHGTNLRPLWTRFLKHSLNSDGGPTFCCHGCATVYAFIHEHDAISAFIVCVNKPGWSLSAQLSLPTRAPLMPFGLTAKHLPNSLLSKVMTNRKPGAGPLAACTARCLCLAD